MTKSRRRDVLAVSAGLALLATVGALAYGLAAPSATLLGPALARQPGSRKEIALTFDDGPSPETARVLDILRDNGVRATFFLCGANAERHPELVRRIVAEGHAIGNHTYSHPYLYLMSRERIAGEIDRTQDALERLSGRRPTLFRPPYGVRWFPLWPLLAQRGMRMVLWSAWGREASPDPRVIARTTLEELRPGAIVLLHDGYEAAPGADSRRAPTVQALPEILRGAREAGYAIVPLSDAPMGPAAAGS
ncbi:MAG TPA: polysaccharide deacetylase family protein [Elusimicrobiota bacterium]|nr:polysaccharide deacetylase family protein [Elusimicrobiota bacterium]